MSSNKKKTEVVHTRIPLALRQKIIILINEEKYRNESHFVREAIEEKICRGE